MNTDHTTTEEREKVGVIGLGIIGSRVAECLRQSGREVYVWNRTPRSFPNFLGSPAELAALVDTIQIFVSDSVALRGVIEAIRSRLEPRHVIIANGTFDPQTVVEISEVVKQTGAAFLDAPFTGSRLAAEAGQLVYYVGGDEATLERVRGVLEVSAKTILPLGGVGEATLLKIATNMISAATVGILSEAYGLVAQAGIDPALLQKALEENACCSPLVNMKLPSILAEDYEPHFSLKNMFKDAQYAAAEAKHVKIDTPMLSTIIAVMYRSLQRGKADQDYSVIAANYQGQSGK